jgi:hypothetical protein
MKYKRITRSILAFKLYSIAYSFNISSLDKTIINKVLEIEVLLVIYTNSKSLYKYLVKLGTTREKRLIINVTIFHSHT